ncbi:MAG: preprotein translocase subunit SecD [Methanobacteriota archaeon]|nr:MAG: preprotein translocase subunit SecD [Euryarchaeota archaeon]
MKTDAIKRVLLDWRVLVLIGLLVVSVIAINPHFEDGELTTDLQYGLDLEGGAWLQLQFKAEVVGFQTDKDPEQFAVDVRDRLDAEVILLDANQIEIRKEYSRADLERIFAEAGGQLSSYEQGISQSTANDVKRIMEEKLNSLGTRDAKVNLLTSPFTGVTQFVRVDLAGVSIAQAKELVGTQGKFEIRIQTTGNATEHVLFGDAITTVGVPQRDPRSQSWGVGFTLTEPGAVALRDAAITYNAVNDPENHELVMLLDNATVYSAPLSPDLANSIRAGPARELIASTGAGEEALEAAKTLEIHLRAGALPVDVVVASDGQVPADRGDYYKQMAVIGGLFAVLTVGAVIYFRYREPGIVLPMMAISISEVVILLGITRIIGQQLDLATIAGLIAVLGTGIDHLVVITDEVLHEGRVPSPNLYLKRLTRALGIIVVAAATVVIAMLPLMVMSLTSLRGFAIITVLGVLIGVTIARPAYGRIIMEILSVGQNGSVAAADVPQKAPEKAKGKGKKGKA